MALTIDDFFDKLMDGIEAVIPRTVSDVRFKRHKAPIVLDLSPGAVRYFKLGVGSVLPQDSAGPHSDGVSAWYGTDTFLVKIWYPAVWVIDGDSTARGIEWLKLQDMIDLNKAICYGDILATLGASYESPQFKGAYQEGNFWVLSYKTAWMELLTS